MLAAARASITITAVVLVDFIVAAVVREASIPVLPRTPGIKTDTLLSFSRPSLRFMSWSKCRVAIILFAVVIF